MANIKRNRPPVRMKMLDLTQDKTSPAVKKVVRVIDTIFQNQVRASNIPAFKVMGKLINLNSFFLDHEDYQVIYGVNSDILDRMMLSAIAEYMAKDIIASIEDAKVNYVGVWDEWTIYNIAAATITFMKNDFDSEMYLTAQQYQQISKEDLEKLPEGTYMPFSQFNPNKFYEQILLIRKVILNVIYGIINNKLPKAFLGSQDAPVNNRLWGYYRNIMADDMRKILDEAGMDLKAYCAQPATERLIRDFNDIFEKPFMTFTSLLLQESGLSQNIINMMLGVSHIFVFYDDPVGKNLGDVNLLIVLTNEKSDLPNKAKVDFNITIQDALDMALLDPTTLPKKCGEIYGKPIRTLLLDLCIYAINIYVDVMTANKPVDENINEDAAAPTEDNAVMDQLLNDAT